MALSMIINPSLFLICSEPIHRIASKTIIRYDSPKKPYQRIMESPDIADEVKKKLTDLFQTLNPFHLRKAMEKRLRNISQLCFKNSS